MIAAKGITKKFGRVAAVDDVSFRLEAGDAMALWGSNGAGKTTLIRCLLGVMRFRGKASIAGLDVARRGRRTRSLVGYVPQELAFHDDARLGPCMLFFARLRNAGAEDAIAALETVGLQGHERKRVRDLSGGMKQRLALAIAMVSDPPIIILDRADIEPGRRRAGRGRAGPPATQEGGQDAALRITPSGRDHHPRRPCDRHGSRARRPGHDAREALAHEVRRAGPCDCISTWPASRTPRACCATPVTPST